jgi:hypothetical protein
METLMLGFNRPRTDRGMDVHVEGELEESIVGIALTTSSPYLLGSEGSPYLHTARRLSLC